MSQTLPGVGRQARFLDTTDAAGQGASRIDVLIVGAGVAGLSVALSLPEQLKVAVVLKGHAGAGQGVSRSSRGAADYRADGSSGHAQGGIAAVFGTDDSPALHFSDTLAAGAGLCEPEAVRVLVDEAPDAVRFLQSQGVHLDGLEGHFDLTREGGHSRRRVVHAGGDATGWEVMRGLTEAAQLRDITLYDDTFLVDLLTAPDGGVCGATLFSGGRFSTVLARAVVLATGGFGRLYAETTSPAVCTGDGLAAALRAGAAVADLEFVQFHPTAIQLSSDPRPLASESLRGEGAVIRNGRGESVMASVDAAGDLAPRDVVSRAMSLEMSSASVDHLFLDATAIGAGIVDRFPSFVGASRRAGIDPVRSWVPVAPAVHYVMGGVRTDLWGRASLRGLYAVGEVAHSGVHGANRLASNSLVEGIVFGRRAAMALSEELAAFGVIPTAHRERGLVPAVVDRRWLRCQMTTAAGVLRTKEGLCELSVDLQRRATPLGREGRSDREVGAMEDANLLLLASTLVGLAVRREESRGAHFRLDAPSPVERWRHHQIVTRNVEGELVVSDGEPLTAPSEISVGHATLYQH